MRPDVRHPQRGFTLIEVLVALAIFGVVALTLMEQTRLQVRQAAGVEDRLLAHWVALNSLTDLQTAPDFVALGTSDTTAVLAGRDWFVTLETTATPSDAVRHVDISVAPYNATTNARGSALVKVTGFVRRRAPATVKP